jgi:hypothetical protein
MKILLVVATSVVVLAGCQEGKPVSVALPAAPPSEAQTCINGKVAALTEARDLLAAGEPWKAHLRVNFCAGLLDDPEYRAVAHATETATRKKDLADETLPTRARLQALDQLGALDPQYAAAQAPLRSRLEALEAAETRKAKAADAARRRKEGVTIGMSQEDVLASSWGRPQRVNRTTTEYATSEQWVYPGGYLYFRNGRLEAVSN